MDKNYHMQVTHRRVCSRVKKQKGQPPTNHLHVYLHGQRQFREDDGTAGVVNHANKIKPHTHGGSTTVSIYYRDALLAVGVSLCSMSDTFSYKRGFKIALGRAMKLIEDTDHRMYIQGWLDRKKVLLSES